MQIVKFWGCCKKDWGESQKPEWQHSPGSINREMHKCVPKQSGWADYDYSPECRDLTME